ncbi:hypothetical protein PAECIP111892_03909 [Paenibacillus auburnensis]|jgi:hypothetical protein|uniref:Uncharacterized protein n=1 Tax=Paenibacillus auburnensis TaxID=2905649 RepID=A0ABM9CJ88_9BACL|nr:hypothetical protein [Paenibacillus auburnensis]CAH1213796.1 hypothetical protein PAECIP111892_03909 [Paenibacillus auburnensis]
MNKIKEYDLPSVRLSAGMYALSKLSAAGLTFMLVSLVLLGLPHTDGVPKGWPVSVPYAVYAYGLPAALIADALLRMFRSSSLGPSLVMYAAAGFGAGLWLASEQGGDAQTCALYGIGVLLLFRLAQLSGERYPLLLPVFALFVPLLCLVLV